MGGMGTFDVLAGSLGSRSFAGLRPLWRVSSPAVMLSALRSWRRRSSTSAFTLVETRLNRSAGGPLPARASPGVSRRLPIHTPSTRPSLQPMNQASAFPLVVPVLP
jgi:hypothetical protein